MFRQFIRAGEKYRSFIIPFAVFLLLTLGCSAADLVQRDLPTPTGAPTRELAPTFTPTPEVINEIIIVTPPNAGTPGVIIVPPGTDPKDVLPDPTETPVPPTAEGSVPGGGSGPVPPDATPTETWTPLPTETFTSTPTETPTPTLTPFIRVPSGLVNLREGPGIVYPLVAQLGPDIPVTVIGQNPEGTWLQICCVSGDSVWVERARIELVNSIAGVELVSAEPPPTPTPTGTATVTATPTPTATATLYPFDKAIGPQFFPTNNEFLTIWSKMFVQPDPQKTPDPAEGYYLQVLFEGFERPPTNDQRPSANAFFESAAKGAGNRVEYNYKYEYLPPDPKLIDCNSLPPNFVQSCKDGNLTRKDLLGTGTWTFFVVDGAGNQLSEEVTFTTSPTNLNREVYIGWNRVR